ncbi:hypothetical protein Tco_1447772 [Tanacetum coccineum]
MVPATTSLIGFSGKIKWPLGQITLLVKIGDDEHSTSAWMDFMVVRSTSPHNESLEGPVECAMVSGLEEQPIPVNKVREEKGKSGNQSGTPGADNDDQQKKIGQAAERNIAINDEVSKLVASRIMREVYYHDWLSNPVMVKKSDNSWRMCIDFKDLNRACPKDGYPLSEID